VRYLVGVDGSAPSDAALTWAATRARRDGVALVVIHVVESDAGRRESGIALDPDDFGRRLLETARSRLRAEAPALEVHTELRHGSPSWSLTRLAHPDDVLVVGTHKTGFSSGRVLGSLSVQIAAASSCTVAVIPATDLRFRRGVVAGIDRDETARHIADLAAREAVARHEELTLVHAGRPADGSGVDGNGVEDSPLRTALDHVRATYPQLTVLARRSNRPPSAALLDTARSKALLVIGPGSTDARSPIRTVVHEVLLNANAPVLVAGAPVVAPA
jgi:nucleotide-binding universal stress UspA family protein